MFVESPMRKYPIVVQFIGTSHCLIGVKSVINGSRISSDAKSSTVNCTKNTNRHDIIGIRKWIRITLFRSPEKENVLIE